MEFSVEYDTDDVRVIHDGAFTGPGGSERVARELARALDAPLTVGHSRYPEFWTDTDLDVTIEFQDEFHAGLSNKFWYSIPRPYTELRVKQKFKSIDFDEDILLTTGVSSRWIVPDYNQIHINYCHTPPPSYYSKTQDSFLEWLKTTGLSMLDKHYMSFVEGFIANSEFIAQRVDKFYNSDAEILHPPIRTSEFEHAPANESDPYFIMISRLLPMKRVDLIAEAFGQLSDVRLVIVGDGPLEEECEQYDNVTIKKRVSDEELEELVSRSVGGIAFGDHEHYGMTTKEYQASGKPVLVPNEPYLRNHVTDGVDGIIVSPEFEDIRRGVKKIMSTQWNPDTIQSTAEKHSRENFHKKAPKIIEKIVSEVEEQ